MKKNKFLGIMLILVMVIALALTGCGQKEEPNAGATGSGAQHESIPDDPDAFYDDAYNDIYGNDDNTSTTGDNTAPGDNKTPTQDANGNYTYTITVNGESMTIATCVNVWDYISSDSPYDRVDFNQMLLDLGWRELPAGFGSAIYTRSDGGQSAITNKHNYSEYNLSSGQERLSVFTANCVDANGKGIENSGNAVSSLCIADTPYIVGKSEKYVSFDQIVAYAYLLDYYRFNTGFAFEDHIAGGVQVP